MAGYANDWDGSRLIQSGAVGLIGADPREEMARRLPAALQGFLTWLTAKPAPGFAHAEPNPMRHLVAAFAWTLFGLALGGLAFTSLQFGAALLPLALLLISSGLGLFQVVIFHHCSHGTVFKSRERNRRVGRM